MQTLTDIPMDLRLRISPKLNLNETVHYTAVLNPSQVIYREFPSQQYSTSNFNINCVFNSRALIDVATAVIKTTFRLTFTGVAGDGVNLLQIAGAPTAPGISSGNRNLDAPRAYPLASVLGTLTANFENTPISSQINRYFQCISRYYNDRASQDLYNCPAMLDNSQSYDDNPEFSSVDPLGAYSVNSSQLPRGGWGDLLVEQNDLNTAIVSFTTYEPVYISPFVFGANRQLASLASPLTGINTLIINGVFSGNNGQLPAAISPLARIWSHRNSATTPSNITGINVEVRGVSACLSYYQSPVTYPLKSAYSYPLYDYLPVQTNAGQTVPAGGSIQIPFNTQTLTSIPARVFIWVALQDANKNYTTTDSALRIDGIKMIFNGQDGILSSATRQQLYGMSKANGLIDSYSDFISRVGSFICLKFGDDIPMPPELSTGVNGCFDFSLTVDCTNISQVPMDVALNCLFQFEGVLQQRGTQWSQTTGALTRRDVVDLQENAVKEQLYITYKPEEMLNGGNIIKKALGWVGHQIMNHTEPGRAFKAVAEKGCKLYGKESKFCNYIKGKGLDGGDDGGYMGGRRRRKSRARGRGLEGGAELSRAELRDLMS